MHLKTGLDYEFLELGDKESLSLDPLLDLTLTYYVDV
jgi:hypothetical protein